MTRSNPVTALVSYNDSLCSRCGALSVTAKVSAQRVQEEHLDAVQLILASVCRDFKAELVEFNGEHDHVHLLYAR
ncbi:transposase [Cupriavidus pampae]|uniref:transposase n=1 Tax=Cupriavidus pampae TaxID=659251 RepID=UPI001CC79D12|nr:transposase [Cupriavidus pampae]